MVRAAGSVLQKGIGHDFAVSAIEVGLGLGFGAVAGVAIGLVSGLVRVVYFAVDPWLTILYALPIVAIAPLLIVELGIGLTAKIVIVTLFAIFPVVLNTIKGVQVSSRTYLDVARVYRASRRLTLTSVVLPGIAPYVLTGLRLAGGRALVGMVVAEFTAADSGIGHRLQVAGSTLDTGLVMLLIIVVGVAGVLYIRGISEAEARVSRWRLEAQS
jgi:ABC-type nitrate/sulfonate/bicarbonate transport system permease component